jgi:hypothetical protein
VFALAIHFHPSLIFTGKAGAYPQTLDSGGNSLAYYDNAIITALKSFIAQVDNDHIQSFETVITTLDLL